MNEMLRHQESFGPGAAESDASTNGGSLSIQTPTALVSGKEHNTMQCHDFHCFIAVSVSKCNESSITPRLIFTFHLCLS